MTNKVCKLISKLPRIIKLPFAIVYMFFVYLIAVIWEIVILVKGED